MKKIIIIYILLNLFLIIVCLLGYSKIKELKKDLEIFEKGKKVPAKKIILEVSIDKNDPIYIYKSRKFPCDEGTGSSYGYNLCSGERLDFADSLLRETVKYRLKKSDDFINRYKEGVLKAKGNSYFVNCLRMSVELKENFIKSQKIWEQMRTLNSEEIGINCDGVSTCTGIKNNGEIKYVLERIEKIKVGDPCF